MAELFDSGVMDVHHTDNGIARVVIDQDRFDGDHSPGNRNTQVVVEGSVAPFWSRLWNLIDDSAGLNEFREEAVKTESPPRARKLADTHEVIDN